MNPLSNKVSIVKFDGDIALSIRKAVNLVGGLNLSKTPILIKPNLCTEVEASGGANVSPQTVSAIIDEILAENSTASINIIESDSAGKYADRAFENLGYYDLEDRYQAKGYDVSVINLSKEPLATVPMEGLYFKEVGLPKILLQQKYFISIAKPKTHELTEITGTLKNQFGCLPEKNKTKYHNSIDQVIVDLNTIIHPDLCLVDGVVGMEGVDKGRLRRLGVFLCGRNPISTDAIMARIMGFKPSGIKHIALAERKGLGTIHPEIVGENIASVRMKFKPAHHPLRKLVPEPLRPTARKVYNRLILPLVENNED